MNLRILNNYRPRLIYGIGLLVRPWLGEGLRDSLILLVMVAGVCLSLPVVSLLMCFLMYSIDSRDESSAPLPLTA